MIHEGASDAQTLVGFCADFFGANENLQGSGHGPTGRWQDQGTEVEVSEFKVNRKNTV